MLKACFVYTFTESDEEPQFRPEFVKEIEELVDQYLVVQIDEERKISEKRLEDLKRDQKHVIDYWEEKLSNLESENRFLRHANKENSAYAESMPMQMPVMPMPVFYGGYPAGATPMQPMTPTTSSPHAPVFGQSPQQIRTIPSYAGYEATPGPSTRYPTDGDHQRCCRKCKKIFGSEKELRFHVYHVCVKPYTCEFCGRTLASAQTLINHMRTHPDSHL